MGEVQMTRCPEKYRKKWRMERQTKPEWQKQKEKEEKREEFRRLTMEKEIAIARMREMRKKI